MGEMNNEQKLKANIAAARLVGIKAESVCSFGDKMIVCEILEGGRVGEMFSLSNPVDCLAVVKKLGETYRVHFYYDNDWCISFPNGSYGVVETYEEAVAAAVMEITDDS